MRKFNPTIRQIIGFGSLFALLCVLPAIAEPYQVELLISVFLNILIAVAYRLILTSGGWSFCHIAIMGVGGYGAALVVTSFSVTPWVGLVTGPAAAVAVAYLLSFPLFRMKGFYFIVGSFVAGEVIRLCWLKYRTVFGGQNGIVGVPALEFAGVDLGLPTQFYFFALAVVLISLAIMYRLEKSRLGLIFPSIASSDVLAASVGVDVRHYRTLTFVVAAFFTGLAGAMQVHYLGVVGPNMYETKSMLAVVVWVVVGGIGHFSGPILGTVVLSFMDDALRGFEEFRVGIYGLLLIVTMVFMPKGLHSLSTVLGGIVRRVKEHRKKLPRTARGQRQCPKLNET